MGEWQTYGLLNRHVSQTNHHCCFYSLWTRPRILDDHPRASLHRFRHAVHHHLPSIDRLSPSRAANLVLPLRNRCPAQPYRQYLAYAHLRHQERAWAWIRCLVGLVGAERFHHVAAHHMGLSKEGLEGLLQGTGGGEHSRGLRLRF